MKLGVSAGLLMGLLGVVPAATQPAAHKAAMPLSRTDLHLEFEARRGRVEFTAMGWPSALTIRGSGSGPGGGLDVRAADNTVSGSLSLDLESLATGIGLRDRHMKEQYLETAHFPQAILKLLRCDLAAVPEGSTFAAVRVPFEGLLALHGVERPLSGHVLLRRSGERLSGTCEFKLRLGDYGVKIPSYLGVTVSEQVQVKVEFVAAVEGSGDAARH